MATYGPFSPFRCTNLELDFSGVLGNFSYGNFSIVLPNNATSYVFIDANGNLNTNTTGFPGNMNNPGGLTGLGTASRNYPVCTVVTSNGSVSTITDNRIPGAGAVI